MLDADADLEVQLAADLAYFARTVKVLPRAGGIMDQDYYHVLLIKFALEAMNEREKLEADRAKPKKR